MIKRSLILGLLLALVCVSAAAQDTPPDEYTLAKWKKFASKKWEKINYSKTLIRKSQIAKMDLEEPDEFDDYVSELALLRGVVFGKRGRIFKDRNIQRFLDRQTWYKPNPDFSNSVLTSKEKENLDLIRLAEAERHAVVEQGDMRLWSDKKIPEDKIGFQTPAGWRILIAEIEAIHGKRFDNEPWLQRYFEERYWYEPKSDYSSTVLNDAERANLELIAKKRSEERNIAVWVGDMDKFQSVLLTDEMLDGLTLSELRLIRNEFFARNGYKFAFPGIAQHFEWREWYVPLKDQSKVALNEIEKRNVELIERREKKMRSNLATEAITEEMLDGMFIEDLRVLRNELFARRGRVFKDPELQKYFASQEWYTPDPEFKDDMLGPLEIKNLAVIKQAEELAMSKFDAFEG
jgi:hypothetical protein